jgi:hypothetical protein
MQKMTIPEDVVEATVVVDPERERVMQLKARALNLAAKAAGEIELLAEYNRDTATRSILRSAVFYTRHAANAHNEHRRRLSNLRMAAALVQELTKSAKVWRFNEAAGISMLDAVNNAISAAGDFTLYAEANPPREYRDDG